MQPDAAPYVVEWIDEKGARHCVPMGSLSYARDWVRPWQRTGLPAARVHAWSILKTEIVEQESV